jgi:hypothetical protein
MHDNEKVVVLLVHEKGFYRPIRILNVYICSYNNRLDAMTWSSSFDQRKHAVAGGSEINRTIEAQCMQGEKGCKREAKYCRVPPVDVMMTTFAKDGMQQHTS